MLKYNARLLINKPPGKTEKFSLNDDLDISKIIPGNDRVHVAGEVILMNLPHEVNVQIKNLHSELKGICSRCLKSFKFSIRVPFSEREFIIDLPEEEMIPGEDVFYIDKKTNEINLEEMISHELLLHFPLTPVCSESCKGLCDQCGINLNEATCSCKHNTQAANSPFKFPPGKSKTC